MIMTADLLELTKVGLDEIYKNEVMNADQIYPRLFNVKDSKKSIEQHIKMAGFGSVPQWNADGGSISYDEPLIGDRILFTHTDYALGWVISHKMLREDLYNQTANSLIQDASQSSKVTIEQTCMNVFIDGFATTGPDGVYFFSGSHPRLDGGTNDNLIAGAFTEANLATAIGKVRRMKNERGQPIVFNLDTLLIPPELEFTVAKVLKAPSVIETYATTVSAANRPNVMQGIIPNIIQTPYLTDNADWYIGASPAQRKTLFYWREKPWFDADKDFDTKGVANSVAFAFSCGYVDYYGWWGSTA